MSRTIIWLIYKALGKRIGGVVIGGILMFFGVLAIFGSLNQSSGLKFLWVGPILIIIGGLLIIIRLLMSNDGLLSSIISQIYPPSRRSPYGQPQYPANPQQQYPPYPPSQRPPYGQSQYPANPQQQYSSHGQAQYPANPQQQYPPQGQPQYPANPQQQYPPYGQSRH